MKTISIIPGLLLMCSLAQAQTLNPSTTTADSTPVNYVIGRQDANSRVWQKIVRSTDKKGNTVYQTNQSYVELATGLNFWRDGSWGPSQEKIEISPDGSSAAAINGQHQVYFPGDIYNGVIKLVTPDGKVLRSQPIGLSYSDGNNSVLLAVVTNSTGAILSTENQVVYTNAFAGLNADLIYTYTRGGFEQDVILREQPPDPASLGLNPQSTRLQVMTEFLKPPQPGRRASTVTTAAGDLEDDSLDFGIMQMGQGKAFSIGNKSPSVGVNKRWLTIQGRQFLIEEVPIVSVANDIDNLPPFAQTGSGSRKPIVSKNLILPSQRLVHASPKALFIAQTTLPSRGLVLDYVTMTSQTNWTFQGDTTYYITGPVTLSGSNTFEGGTVIKYTNNAMITLPGAAVNWLAGPYRPVIFTAWNDNSVGDTISGSTGNPTNNCANAALRILFPTTFNQPMSNFRIAYAVQAVWLSGSANYSFYDGQIVNCQNGFYGQGSVRSYLRNILFTGVQTNFNNLQNSTFDVQNATFNSSSYLSTVAGYGFTTMILKFTNCIFANITALTNNPTATLTYQILGGTNGFYSCPAFGSGQITNSFYPFQAVGAGNYYLTNGCSFLNAGTTNINPVLLAGLQNKTTYPPILLSNIILSANTTLSPQAQRDTDAPDLGYHYPALDYLITGVHVQGTTLTLGQGVALGVYGQVGFDSYTAGTLISQGTAVVHNQLCWYPAVQEQPLTLGNNLLVEMDGYDPPARLIARFTDFNGMSGMLGLVDGMDFQIQLWGCDIGPGSFSPSSPPGGDYSDGITNCLFERVNLYIDTFDWECPVYLYNNTVFNSTVQINDQWEVSNYRTIKDNLFDHSTITVPYPNDVNYGYNAYSGGTTALTPPGAGDFNLTTLTYASGPLGNRYIDSSTSPTLVDKGNVTANQLGLYHFTTQVTQTIEGNSQVDIGFHYVATDQNGNPLDADSDGVPDYLEDTNGNGLVDNGENSWTTYNSINGLISGSGLIVFTPLK